MAEVSSPLKVEADPEELGFDPARLARIDDHFARYVDDGRLAGWHAVVARDGKVVHSSTAGRRDAEADDLDQAEGRHAQHEMAAGDQP